MAGDGSMDQNDLVGHCKFSDRLLRVLEKRKQCDAEKQDWKFSAPKKVICEKVTTSETEDK